MRRQIGWLVVSVIDSYFRVACAQYCGSGDLTGALRLDTIATGEI